MILQIPVLQILAIDLMSVSAKIMPAHAISHPELYSREIRRLYMEPQYRLLVWLGRQFTGSSILDIGTRSGVSAICLADNPANIVTTYDKSSKWKIFDIQSLVPGMSFFQKDAASIPDATILKSPLIYLDISHNGTDELEFLNRLKSIGYTGFIFMDDVETVLFPELRKVFNEFEGNTLLMPKEISHDTGTGVVMFGDTCIKIH